MDRSYEAASKEAGATDEFLMGAIVEEWAGKPTHRLTELQAFDAMRAFIEAYWERGGKQSDDIAVLLGNLDRNDGPPLDMAQWHDWLNAVAKHKPVEKPD